MSNTVFQSQTIKVRVKDNGTLQSTTPVTLKNAIGQKRTLTELFDVQIVDPANSQILAYQANTSQWINRTATTIAGNTNQIVVANTNAFDFTLSLPNTVSINQSLVVGNGFTTNSSVTTIANGNFGTINVASAYIANGIIVGGSASLRNIIPDANNAYTIGNSSFRYATLWLSGNTFYMGNVVFTDTATNLGLTTSNGSPISVSMGNTTVNGSLSVSAAFSADSLTANTLTIQYTSDLRGSAIIGSDGASYVQIYGSSNSSFIASQSLSSNSNIAIVTKGGGSLDITTGNTGVVLSNGNTVTTIGRVAAGNNYTSFPTWTASSPTVEGGTVASGNVATLVVTAAAIAALGNGTGYTNGDIITIAGGTFTTAATLQVTSNATSNVTAITVINSGEYSVLPTNPVSVTGGTGTGATFNLYYGIGNTFNITVPGSGYNKPPTITLSGGGGGTGAAVFATIGANTRLQSAGQSLTVVAPSGTNSAYFTDNLVTIPGGGPNTGIVLGNMNMFAFLPAGGNRGNPAFRTTLPNSQTVLRVLPNGVPSTNDYTTQTQFEFFADDYFSNPNYWHNFRILAQSNRFVIDTARGANTQLPRPIVFDIGGQSTSNATNANFPAVLVLSANGKVGINTANPSAQLEVAGTANIQSTLTAVTLVAGNTTVNGWANVSGNLTVGGVVVGANLTVNATAIFLGNSTVNSTHTSTLVQVSNSTSTANLTAAGIVVGTTVANATVLAVGANVIANTTALFVGNSTVNTIITSSSVATGNVTTTGFINVATTANVGGAINARSTLTVNGALTVANTAALGNTTITGFANVVGNLQVTDTIAGNNMTLSGNLTVSGTTTYINTTTLNVGDNIVTLNADVTGATAPSENAGIEINRGSSANVSFLWNETNDYWDIGNTNVTGYVNASSVNVTGAATVNGALTVNNTASFGNTTITGFANVVGNVNITNVLSSANISANNLSSNNFLTNQIAVITSAGNANIAPTVGIAGWNYSGKFKSVSAEESNPLGLFLSPDGLNLYVNGSTGDDVNQYTLSTAWDVSTATYVRIFSTAAQDSAPNDIFFKPDGLTMFIMGGTNDIVYQYTLSSAWDISTASYASKSFSVTTQESLPTGMWFKSDGTAMYIIGTTSDTVFQYTLSTPWDVSTASYASISFSITTQESSPQQVVLSADGTKMWVIGTTGDDINEYNLGTAWNVGTATFVNNFYVGFQDASIGGLFIDSSAANRVYLVGTTNDTVYQYNTVTNSISANTDVFNTSNNARVQGNLAVQSNLYVDGAITTQGGVTAGGTGTFNGLTSSGTTSLATSTSSQTVSLGAGATTSGSTKAMNIGTAGVSGSITNINIGSAVSGATSNTLLYSNTFIVTGGNTHLGGLIGGESFRVIPTVNSNNYLQVAGAVTGSGPTLSAQGVDLNVGVNILGKGTGVVNISPSLNVPGGATVNGAFVVNNTASLGNTTITGFANISSTANIGGILTARSDVTVNGALTVSNTAALGNTAVTGFVNATASVNSAILSVGTAVIANSTGVTTTGFVNVATTVSVGANVIANTTALFVGNSSVNTVVTSANITSNGINANTITANIATFNTSANVGANVQLTTSQLAIGNATVNTVITSSAITGNPTIAAGNTTVTGFVNATASVNSAILSVGTAVIANSTGITTTGFVNAAGAVNAASHTVGTAFVANSTGITTTGFANVGGRIIGNLGGADANTYAGFGLDINSAVIRVGDAQSGLVMANGTGFKIHDSGNSHKSIGQLGNTFYISDTSTDGNSLFPTTRTDILAANTTLATLGVNTAITGFVNVTSTANIGGAITARSDVTVNGALTVANTASLGNTTITGFANISSTANIGGALTARSTVTVNGALTVANTAALGNTTITGDATVTANLTANNLRTTGSVQIDGNLTVSGNTITIGVTNLAVSDNIIYLNEPETATITSATSNGTAFIYTALNGYSVGQVVTVTGMTPGGYNVAANTITFANSTTFAVANTTAPGAYVSGGSAVARVDTNPDIGFAANYNDGTYRHAGFFRDATDGVFKVFDQYQPEPSGAFIDTSNNTFRIAAFQANATTLGTLTTGNTIINGTANVTGTANIAGNTQFSANAWVSGNFGIGNNTSSYKLMVEGGAPWFKPNVTGANAAALYLGRFSDVDSPAYTIRTDDATSDGLTFLSSRYNGYYDWRRNSGSGEMWVASLQGINGNRTDFALYHNESDNTVKVLLSTGSDSYINTAANVGIGTSAPNAKLQVAGTANISGVTTVSSNVNIVGANLYFTGTSSLGNFIKFTANTPGVHGIDKPSSNSSVSQRFDFYNAGSNNALNPFWGGYHFTAPDGAFSNSTAGTGFPRVSLYHSYTSTANPTDLYFNIVPGNGPVGVGHGVRVYAMGADTTLRGIDIAANGNIGIGNGAPADKLSVFGTVAFTNSTANVFNVAANGNVGVGTASPYDKFQVAHNSNTQGTVTLFNANNDTTAKAVLTLAANTTSMVLYQNAPNSVTGEWGMYSGSATMFKVSTNATSRFVISANGNVGIGNNVPTHLLRVEGTGSFSGSLQAPTFDLGTNMFFGNSGGNPVLNFDSNDYLTYNKTNNQLSFFIGGNAVLLSNTTNLQVNSAANITSTLTLGGNTIFNGNTITYNGSNTSIAMRVLPDGVLSFEGGAGQLFSIANSLTGQIFAVNDISGIPSIEVYSNGQVNIAKFGGNVSIGTSTSTITVNGSVTFANTLTLANNLSVTGFVNATASVNSAVLSVGTSFIANTTGAYHTGTVNGAVLSVGTAVIANSVGITTTGFANVGTTVSVGANVIANTTALFVGNSTVNTSITQTTASFNANSSAVALFVAANGNIGLGNATPTWKLHVMGSTRIENQYSQGGGNNFEVDSVGTQGGRFRITSDGTVGSPNANVGIGNTAPVHKLSVNGNAFIGSSLNVATTFASGNATITGFANVVGNLQISDTIAGNNLTLSGNLTVSGTTTYINTTNLNVGDNIITLNADLGAVAPTEDSGFIVNRGTSANVSFTWDETNDRWTFGGDGANNVVRLSTNSLTTTALINSSGIWDYYGNTSVINAFAEFSIFNGVNRLDNRDRSYLLANSSANNVIFAANGNVGIGNMTPANKFNVRATSNTQVILSFLENNDTGTGAVTIQRLTAGTDKSLTLYAAGGGYSGMYGTATAPTFFYDFDTHAFRTLAGTSQLYIAANGNVGIGNSTPTSALVVERNADSNNPTALFRNTTTGTGALTTIRVTGDTAGSQLDIGVASNTYGGYGLIGANSAFILSKSVNGLGIFADNASSYLRFGAGGTSEHMRLNANGGLYVGVTGDLYGRQWMGIYNKNQNATTQLGVINANTGASAEARFSLITGTGNSFMDWNLNDAAGVPTSTIGFGSAVGTFRINVTNTSGSFRVANSSVVAMHVSTANGNVGIGNSTPAQTLVVAGTANVSGNLAHGGLVMTTGTNVDQIYTATPSLTLNTTWQSTGVTSTNLANGTYVVQLLANDVAAGGTANNEYYSGMMSWYSADTNSTILDEIPLHRAGVNGSNNSIFLATQRTATANTSDLILMISSAANNSSSSTYTLKFRRMI